METGDDEKPAAQPPGERAPAGLASVAAIRCAVESDLMTELWQLTDTQAREGLAESFAAAQQVQAAYLRRVADLDSRPGAVAGVRPGAVAKTFLIHKLRRNIWDAGNDVRAAQALLADADPALGGLPRLGAALARGEISREHANVAVKAMHRLPAHLLCEPAEDHDDDVNPANPEHDSQDDGGDSRLCQGDFVDGLLTEQSRRNPPGTVVQLTRYLQHAADPDGSRSFDPDAVTRRGVSLFQDPTGMTVIRGELDQANGALLRAAEDGTLIEMTDARTARQRAADALGVIARIALDSGKAGSKGGEAPRILIHTDLPTLAAARQILGPRAATDQQTTPGQPAAVRRPAASEPGLPGEPGQLAVFGSGDPVDPAMLGRLACDAVLQRALLAPSGAVTDE